MLCWASIPCCAEHTMLSSAGIPCCAELCWCLMLCWAYHVVLSCAGIPCCAELCWHTMLCWAVLVSHGSFVGSFLVSSQLDLYCLAFLDANLPSFSQSSQTQLQNIPKSAQLQHKYLAQKESYDCRLTCWTSTCWRQTSCPASSTIVNIYCHQCSKILIRRQPEITAWVL